MVNMPDTNIDILDDEISLSRRPNRPFTVSWPKAASKSIWSFLRHPKHTILESPNTAMSVVTFLGLSIYIAAIITKYNLTEPTVCRFPYITQVLNNLENSIILGFFTAVCSWITSVVTARRPHLTPHSIIYQLFISVVGACVGWMIGAMGNKKFACPPLEVCRDSCPSAFPELGYRRM